MNFKGYKVRAIQAPWRDTIDLFFMANNYDGTITIIENVVMRTAKQEELAIVETPPISLPPEIAQSVMDALWTCGIRPTEGAGSAGAMAKAEAHIKDLQKISRRLLGIVEK